MEKKSFFRIWLPLVLLIVGISIAFYARNNTESTNNAIISAATADELVRVTLDIKSTIKEYEFGLRGLRGAVETVGFDDFGHSEHLRYSKSRDYAIEYPGARGFGIIRKVKQENLAEFLATAAVDRNGAFNLKQLDNPLDPLFIIQYIEPESANAEAIGLDIGSEEFRRHAALISASTKTTQLSGPITLVQANDKAKHGFLLLHPIYRTIARPPSNELYGWSYTPLLINEILDSLDIDYSMVKIDIADVTALPAIDFYSTPYENTAYLENFNATSTNVIYGRQWSIKLTPTENFIQSLNLNSTKLVFLQIIVTTILIVLLTYFLEVYFLQRLIKINHRIAFASVVNNSSDGIIGVDSSFIITHWNEAADSLFGFEQSSAQNKPLIDWLSQSIAIEKLVNIFKTVSDGHTIKNVQFIHNADSLDGDRFLNVNIAPINSNGQFTGATFSFNDLTESNLLYKNLVEENQNLLNKLHDNSKNLKWLEKVENIITGNNKISLLVCNLNGDILLASKAAADTLDYSEAGIKSANVLNLISYERAKQYNSKDFTFNALVRKLEFPTQVSENKVEDCLFIPRRGERFNGQVNISTMLEGNSIFGYVFFLTDLRITSEIEKKVLLLEATISHFSDMVFWLDTNEKIIALSQNTEKSIRTEKNDLIGSKLGDYITRESREVWDLNVTKLFSNEQTIFSVHLTNLKDEHKKVRMTGSLLEVNGNKILCISAVPTDRTLNDSNIIDTTFTKNNRVLQRVENFSGNIRHEFSTPLTTIIGYLNFLENSPLNDEQSSYINELQSSVSALSLIIDEVLDLVFLNHEKLSLSGNEFELDELLSEISTALIGIVDQRKVEVHFDVESNVPYVLKCDRDKLKRILLHLGSNAVKFTDIGEIVIKISALENKGNFDLQVTVSDTGIGISPDNLTDIFNVFTQIDSSEAREYKGLGVGLTIVKRYIELMHGNITVTSKQGEGSEFTFTVQVEKGTKPSLIEKIQPQTNTVKVLIVDDCSTSIRILKSTLAQMGWDVTTTNNAEDALDLLQTAIDDKKPYHLALIDWIMPGKDGWLLGKQIRKAFNDKDMPILIMATARNLAKMEKQFEKNPNIFNGYLTKPVTRTQIHDAYLDAIQPERALVSNNEKISKESSLRNTRILIVDDNIANQRIAKELLASRGASVSLAHSGSAAVRELENSILPFDVVLMDIHMPGMSGFDAAARIRLNKSFNRLAIIPMTTNLKESEKDYCLSIGMTGHIAKPFNIDHMVTEILSSLYGVAHEEKDKSAPKLSKLTDILSNEVIEFCRTHRIDIPTAFERFSFAPTVFVRALNLFTADLQSYSELLSQDSFSRQELVIMFHTLKGTASSLGFDNLAALAANQEEDIEQWLVSNPKTKEQLAVITKIDEELGYAKLLQAKLETIPNIETHYQSDIDEADFKQHLETLENEVTSFNMHAIDTFQNILVPLNAISPELTDNMITALNELNFKEAKKLLLKIEAAMAGNHNAD